VPKKSVQRSKDQGRRKCRRRNFKDSCNFQESSKNSRRRASEDRNVEDLTEFVQIFEKLLQKAASLKAFWKLVKLVKDCSRQCHALKNPCISFKSLKNSRIFLPQEKKNASHLQRTTIEAIRFVLRTDPEMETSSEGMSRARKRKNNSNR
jgi:hypothetical protein